jgi:hypothetical protein
MKKYFKSFKQNANLSNRGAMESGDHFKNGASPKSLTSRGNKSITNKVKMKNFIFLLLFVFTIVYIQSCTTMYGTITTTVEKPDIVITPELRAFLKNNPNPRLVVRVPSASTVVTADNTYKDYNNLYGQIERVLMEAGFTVRDRGLLASLLASGQSNYKEIGEKAEVDLIIEISAPTVKYAKTKNVTYKKGYENNRAWRKELDVLKENLHVEEYTIDSKIILVEKGLTIGMLSFQYSACETAEPGYFIAKSTDHWKYDFDYSRGNAESSSKGWVGSLTWYVSDRTLSRIFGMELVNLFKQAANDQPLKRLFDK